MLNRDFREFIESLNASGVRYLIIGGYAVAYHGHPRYTKDLDVWVEPTPENAERMVAALERFGFGSLGLTAADFLDPDKVIQLGQPPIRIDVVLGPAGVEFEACYASRQTQVIDGVAVNFLDLDSLRRNKAATGRPQDLADLEHLR